ncbi:MAG: type 4a pilus biogenesis protein PilO [Planctomycetes bacterium]|jgi:Tfp pilus assembly protein PilO|nr:type 4a pilus biogenesis protein PilO [Phycisphaerae bacterium]NBB94189.1 type 4a pilus biogenesis protein PilO [Planctomycetota bacterium]
MNKLSLRELVFVLLLFGIIVGQWRLVLTPRTQRREELSEDVAEKQEQLNELEQARALARQNLDGEIARLHAKIETLHEFLPSQNRRHGIITELKGRADAYGLVTLESRMSEPVPSDAGPKNDNITEGEFFMRLRGNYVSFFSFLEAVERMDCIVKVDRIVLSRMAGQSRPAREGGGDTQDDEDGNVSVELQLTFYFSD